MEITVERSLLYSAAQKIAQYSKQQSSLEVLKLMRIDSVQEGDREGLILTCSNIGLTVSMFIPAQIRMELRSFCIDARRFARILKATLGNELKLTYNAWDNTLAITCDSGMLTVKCETTEDFILSAMQRWDQLKPEELRPAGNLVDLAKRVAFCSSKDEARPVLQGVNFGPDSVAATDGFRIGYVEENSTGFEGLIPASAVTAMSRLIIGEAKYHKEPGDGIYSGLYIQSDDVRLHSVLIDGNFPNYKAIIPHERKLTVQFSVKEMKEALRFAEVVYSLHDANVVRCDIGDTALEITSTDDEFGKTRTEISIDTLFDDTNGNIERPFKIALNGRMLMDYLCHARECEVRMDIVANNRPVAFHVEGDPLKCVIMPMHLG